MKKYITDLIEKTPVAGSEVANPSSGNFVLFIDSENNNNLSIMDDEGQISRLDLGFTPDCTSNRFTPPLIEYDMVDTQDASGDTDICANEICTDGKYIFNIPLYNPAFEFHGKLQKINLGDFRQSTTIDLPVVGSDAELKGFYGGIVVGDYLYLMPRNYKKMVRVDLRDDSITILDLSSVLTAHATRAYMTSIVVYKNYLIAYCYYDKVLVKINIPTFTYVSKTTVNLPVGVSSISFNTAIDNVLYCLFNNGINGKIMTINLNDLTEQTIYLDDGFLNFYDMIISGDFLYILAWRDDSEPEPYPEVYNKIYKINRHSMNLESYINLEPSGIYSWSKIVLIGKYLYVCPGYDFVSDDPRYGIMYKIDINYINPDVDPETVDFRSINSDIACVLSAFHHGNYLYMSCTDTDDWEMNTKLVRIPIDANLGFCREIPENIYNKTSAFQETPDDIHYPTEKLVKDSLDGKQTAFIEGENVFLNSTFLSKEFVNVNSGTITRDIDGEIETVAITDGRTLTISRNIDGTIDTVSDGTRTWTFTYTDGLLTSWSVV